MFIGKYFMYDINIQHYLKSCDLEVYNSENKSNSAKKFLQVSFSNSQTVRIQFLL